MVAIKVLPSLKVQGPRHCLKIEQRRCPASPRTTDLLFTRECRLLSCYKRVVLISLFFLLQEQDFLPPATRIRNEIEEGEGFSGDDDDDEDDEEERKRSGRGAEVAPPCDMGYYGASQVFLGLFFSFCWKLLLLHEYIPRVEDEAEVDSAAMRTWLMPSLLA